MRNKVKYFSQGYREKDDDSSSNLICDAGLMLESYKKVIVLSFHFDKFAWYISYRIPSIRKGD